MVNDGVDPTAALLLLAIGQELARAAGGRPRLRLVVEQVAKLLLQALE